MDTDTEITPQNAYKPFGSVLLNRETEVVASITDAPVLSHLSVTSEATEVEHDNVVTETQNTALFTATPELPRVTRPARKNGRPRVSPAWQADYVMD